MAELVLIFLLLAIACAWTGAWEWAAGWLAVAVVLGRWVSLSVPQVMVFSQGAADG